ncbi:LysR family transcriptional regulator [Pseudocolwellia sp. HL-MZ19]|uniref:LysR family transcriptional regulator n=1 Tax=unclassified Pseudocolwellia TaxID=2848178 RepID=UPI003CF435F7
MRHLKAFHIFNVAAQTSNFSEAALSLCITHGAVSKQIKILEDYLALKLFYKQGRNVRLTPEGNLLKSYTFEAFQMLDKGVNKLSEIHQTSLNVSCEPTLTMRWLMPRMSGFYEQNLNMDIRLSTAGGSINLDSSDLSMAIRRDDFEFPAHYKSIHLVDEWIGPVVSPEYWKQIKGDLKKVKLIHSDTRQNAWLNWAGSTDNLSILKNPSQNFAHFYFCFQAAVDGLGAALGSYPLVVDDLKRGNLIAPFGFVPSGHRYILLGQDSIMDNGLSQKFIMWIQNELMQCIPADTDSETS